jgi:hypothetical protein
MKKMTKRFMATTRIRSRNRELEVLAVFTLMTVIKLSMDVVEDGQVEADGAILLVLVWSIMTASLLSF